MWCFPSGRVYPVDKSRVEVSSSTIRNVIVEAPKNQILQKLGGVLLNGEMLMGM